MLRRKASGAVADVLSSTEKLRTAMASIQSDIRNKARDLALAIVHQPLKKRGRPPNKLGRPKAGREREEDYRNIKQKHHLRLRISYPAFLMHFYQRSYGLGSTHSDRYLSKSPDYGKSAAFLAKKAFNRGH